MNALEEIIEHAQKSDDPYWKARGIDADMEINNLIFRADQKADMQERDVWSHLYAELSGNDYGGAYSLDDLKRVVSKAAAELADKNAVIEAARRAVPYLRNCAEHHRDDSVLEDKIIPAIEDALAKLDGAK